ncbi:MAG: hypothetical protein AAGF97_11335 [Planctomycetota bacterium]
MIRLDLRQQRLATQTEPVTSNELFQFAAKFTERLAGYAWKRKWRYADFEELEKIVAGLPLASEDFSVANCRIRNAKHSLEKGEAGAARYELMLLARSLKVATV